VFAEATGGIGEQREALGRNLGASRITGSEHVTHASYIIALEVEAVLRSRGDGKRAADRVGCPIEQLHQGHVTGPLCQRSIAVHFHQMQNQPIRSPSRLPRTRRGLLNHVGPEDRAAT
jgi:hypothetical protein